jgi:hypothetical protein
VQKGVFWRNSGDGIVLALESDYGAWHRLSLYRLCHGNSYSNGCADHWIVTHAEEAHHLNVGRNGA